MKTGLAPSPDHHLTSFVTAAASVFMNELCRAMIQYQQLNSDKHPAIVARSCALAIMQTQKTQDLEKLVNDAFADPDGMPRVENTQVVQEVFSAYDGISAAERNGDGLHYRQNILVPNMVQVAIDESQATSDHALNDFCRYIDSFDSSWSLFAPSTPFQQIVCNAINNLPTDCE